MEHAIASQDERVYSIQGRVFGTISLLLTLASLFQGFLAIAALVFAVICYIKNEKNLGMLAMIMSIVYFLTVIGFNVYYTFELGGDALGNLGALGAADTFKNWF